MSFSLTTRQMRARTKTVTRRLGWWFLKPGDLLCAIEKGRGLKKGEKVKRIAIIRVVSTGPERLNLITAQDVKLEGFTGITAEGFVEEFCRIHRGCKPETEVNRIQFAFV